MVSDDGMQDGESQSISAGASYSNAQDVKEIWIGSSEMIMKTDVPVSPLWGRETDREKERARETNQERERNREGRREEREKERKKKERKRQRERAKESETHV